jgi:osmotically inducible protein OsmC
MIHMRTTNAHAIWKGNLKEGNGKYHLPSTGYKGIYTFATRFGDRKGSNPEELIGAAHAACFSMALSNIVAEKGYNPLEVNTEAKVMMEAVEAGVAITSIHLETKARIEGISDDVFQHLAADAKNNCPVSKALSAIRITLDASLI